MKLLEQGFHYRSSKFIDEIHVDPIIKMDHNLNNFKALYIPTNFSNNVRYSAFRDIDDADINNGKAVY